MRMLDWLASGNLYSCPGDKIHMEATEILIRVYKLISEKGTNNVKKEMWLRKISEGLVEGVTFALALKFKENFGRG